LISQRDLNRGPYPFSILDDFICPKPDDSPSLALHRSRPTGIRFDLESMMIAIDFNNEFPGNAREVREVRSYRMLPAKFHAVDPSITDQIPTDLFRPTAITTQLSGF
jgi:hypothetical protein